MLRVSGRVIEDGYVVAGAGLKEVNPGHASEFRGLSATDLSELEHFQRCHEAQVVIEFGTGHFDRSFKTFRNCGRKGESVHGRIH